MKIWGLFMKVIKSGKPWSIEIVCTGNGNGGGGCQATLEIEKEDLYLTHRYPYDGSEEKYITFRCISCDQETDVDTTKIPQSIKKSIKFI